MKTHFENRSLRNIAGNAFAGIFVLCVFVFTISGQAPPNPVPAQENIPAGAFIIPMDNFNQGNNAQTTFNLRAYGLVNLLLHHDIPVKWAIKPGKAKDATDFTASFTRVQGTAGSASGTNVAFSGGPFIIMPGSEAFVIPLLAMFPTVTVYRTTAPQLIDIRYTLTHKPKVAIGPDGGNFGSNVHQAILDSAGITNYELVNDDTINSASCFSIATQAHSTNPTFVNLYRQFVESGANLLLQCASIDTFENNAAGHFQTTIQGYSVFGTNAPANAVDTTLLYPEGAMPFNQFIGILANQDGAVTDYAFAPGGAGTPDNRISVRNTGSDSDKFVATVSSLNGPGAAGGNVFELGGHDYDRPNTVSGAQTALSMINGRRMYLNALFVPATRPPSPRVVGFKSVIRVDPPVSAGMPGVIRVGNTVEWTIIYKNNSSADITNFQIRDIMQENLELTTDPIIVTATAGSSATPNLSYTGMHDDSTSNLLEPAAFLAANGHIKVKVRMKPVTTTSGATILTLRNQTVASGTGLPQDGSLTSDNIDETTIEIAGPGTTPPAGSVRQPQVVCSNDPTRFTAPTAASVSIEGSVRTSNGNGIFNALVTAVNAANGVATSVRTNSLGQYLIEDLQAGDLYIVTVQHKRYRFPNGTVTFTLSDSVTGLAFIGNLPEVKGGRESVIRPIRSKR